MPHVDEGLLHAYLDGAFAPGDTHGVEIEAHLASCADCRARLEDARELKDRAREVLHYAAPADVPVPPFEALHARKHAGLQAGTSAQAATEESVSARRLARSPWRLAWAASVILAVGAGWMAHEVARRGGVDFGAMPAPAPQVDVHDGRATMDAGAEANAAEGPAETDTAGSTAAPSGERPAAVVSVDEPRAETESSRAPPSREGDTGESESANASRPARVDSAPAPAVVPAPTTASDEAIPLARTFEEIADRDADREPPPPVVDLRRRQSAAQAEAERAVTVPAAPSLGALSISAMRTYSTTDLIALDTMPPALSDGRAFAGHVALTNDYAAAVSSGLWSPATTAQVAAALGRQPVSIVNSAPIGAETAVVNGRVLVRQHYALENNIQVELIQRPASAAPPTADRALFREASAALPPAGIAFKYLGDSSPTFRGESVVAVSRPGLVILLKGSLPQHALRDVAALIR